MHSRVWRGGAAVLLCLGLACGQDALPDGPAAVSPAGAVEGAEGFLLGANYPWRSYGTDFGSNSWGSAGVADSGDYDRDFASMRANGAHVVRWFVFGDGRGGITYAADGTPAGLHRDTLADLDAAVGLAKKHDLYLVLVLFDFSLLGKPSLERGVQLGGRSALLTDAAKRTALIDRVVAPVISRYADETRILAWEVMNEPEWAITDLPGASVAEDVVPMTMVAFWDFASRVSSLVHERTRSQVTVGGASLKWVRVWTDAFAASRGLPSLGLDFYQVHHYPWMDGKCTRGDPLLGDVCWSPLAQPVPALGLDKPVVVGEFEARTGVSATLDRLVANGYGGALVWSFRTDDPVDWQAVRRWEAAHRDDLRRAVTGISAR